MKLGSVMPKALCVGAVCVSGLMIRRDRETMDDGGCQPLLSNQDGNSGALRNAWNDCGGKGASDTMTLRTAVAKLEGKSPEDMPREWVGNAGQHYNMDENRPFDNNGFHEPNVVFMRECQAHEDGTACTNDEHCQFDGENCSYNPSPKEYDQQAMFPADRGLFSAVHVALGKAEEVTLAGIVELTAEGKSRAHNKHKADARFKEFAAEQFALTGHR